MKALKLTLGLFVITFFSCSPDKTLVDNNRDIKASNNTAFVSDIKKECLANTTNISEEHLLALRTSEMNDLCGTYKKEVATLHHKRSN